MLLGRVSLSPACEQPVFHTGVFISYALTPCPGISSVQAACCWPPLRCPVGGPASCTGEEPLQGADMRQAPLCVVFQHCVVKILERLTAWTELHRGHCRLTTCPIGVYCTCRMLSGHASFLLCV